MILRDLEVLVAGQEGRAVFIKPSRGCLLPNGEPSIKGIGPEEFRKMVASLLSCSEVITNEICIECFLSRRVNGKGYPDMETCTACRRDNFSIKALATVKKDGTVIVFVPSDDIDHQ